MAEFTVGEKEYKSGKLSAFQQFHVARKLGPMLAKMAPSAQVNGEATSVLSLMAPMLDALSQASEADCDYVLQRCLSVVQRHQGNNAWAPIWNDAAKRFQFEDIDMVTMLEIAVQVLMDNLGNFTNVPALNSIRPAATSSSLPSS